MQGRWQKSLALARTQSIGREVPADSVCISYWPWVAICWYFSSAAFNAFWLLRNFRYSSQRESIPRSQSTSYRNIWNTLWIWNESLGFLQKSHGHPWGKIVGNEGCRKYSVPKLVTSLGGVVPSCLSMSDYLLVFVQGTRMCEWFL